MSITLDRLGRRSPARPGSTALEPAFRGRLASTFWGRGSRTYGTVLDPRLRVSLSGEIAIDRAEVGLQIVHRSFDLGTVPRDAREFRGAERVFATRSGGDDPGPIVLQN
jgi:hypothetical protein